MAVERGDRLRHGLVIVAQQVLQVFGIEPGCQRRRSDQVAEHHGQVPALSVARCQTWCRSRRRRRRGTLELGDGAQQPLAVTERGHAELPQVLVTEVRENVELDPLFGERLRVASKAEILQPLLHVVHGDKSTDRNIALCCADGCARSAIRWNSAEKWGELMPPWGRGSWACCVSSWTQAAGRLQVTALPSGTDHGWVVLSRPDRLASHHLIELEGNSRE